MEKIKILFVGLGGIGQRHLRNLKKLLEEKAEIYAYRKRKAQFVLTGSLEIEADVRLDEKYKLKCVESMEEAYEKGVRIVFICNPTSMHMEILKSALEAQCDVFLEKPVSDSLEGIEEIKGIIKRQQNKVFVGYQNRYHPCIKKTKKLVVEKAIGDIVAVCAEIGECVKSWHKYENYKDMYACRKKLGGGVVVTQIHELDYLYYLFGMPKEVYAVGGQLSDLDIDVEDVVQILMKFSCGTKEIPVSVHEDYLQTPANRGCKIIGTKGKIEFDLLKAEVRVYDVNGILTCSEVFCFERNDMFVEELKDFLKSVIEGSEVLIPFEEGIKSLEIAMAVRESMWRGEIIRL